MTDENKYVTEKTFKEFLEEERKHHVRDETAGAQRGRQISELLKKTDAMQSSIDSISKWRVRVDGALTKHDHALFGNGEPGMDEVLRNINRWIGEQKEEQTKTKQLDKEITLMGIKVTSETKIAVINGVFMLVVALIAWFSK